MENSKIEKAPAEVNQIIEHYRNIQVEGKTVVCPYFRNVKRVRAELRSLVGKGTPEEIEEEIRIYGKLRGFDLQKSSQKEIREFMQMQGIGIDCSGFVSQVLDVWVQSLGKGRIWNNIKFPKTTFYRSIIRMFRPVENISADLLTSELNTEKVELKNVRVGDLLRLKGLQRGHHVAIVTEVERSEKGVLQSFKYAESSENYGDENGVRISEVQIIDERKELKDQKWLGVDKNDVCWTLKQLEREYEDNGLRRLLFFERTPM